MYFQGAGERCVIRRSVFRQAYATAIDHNGAGRHITLEESVIIGAHGRGVLIRGSNAEMTVKNSVIVGNRAVGINAGSTAKIHATENIFYANGINVYFAGTAETYVTEEDFARLSEHANMSFTDTIVANPGFANLNDGWDFNMFYANSPALKENSGFERDIGPHQDPPVVPVHENTYYVNADGGDDSRTAAEAQNKNTPWLTIAKAAEHAIAGDTVLVQPGVYAADSLMIVNGGSGDLPVHYLADGDVTVEVTGGSGFILERVGGVILDGFRITGQPTGWSGANVLVDSSFDVIIQNCEISGFTTGSGGKSGVEMRNRSADIKLRDTLIHSGQYGISQAIASGYIERCLIYSNSVGIYQLRNNNRIFNSAIYDNNINIQGTWDRYSIPVFDTLIKNCVVAGAANDGIHVYRETVAVVNTIIAGNERGISETDDAASTANARYNAFHDNNVNFLQKDQHAWNDEEDLNAVSGWNNNIVADPLFADVAFRLSPESPCIDAGTPTTKLETDFFGNPRRTGAAVDIGLYEVPPRPSMIIVR